LCDADEESSNDILSEELGIDSDDINLEIDGENSSNEMSDSESESKTSVVAC
jgi:hypothetical protein